MEETQKTPEGVYDDINQFALRLTFEDGEQISFKTYEEAESWFDEKAILMEELSSRC